MKLLILFLLFNYVCCFSNNSIKKISQKLNLAPNEVQNSLLVNTFSATWIKEYTENVLTEDGLVSSWILGNTIWLGFGFEGWVYMLSYFALGSIVTKLKFKEKEEKGIEEKRSGARGYENVLGSGATASIFSILSLLSGYNYLYNIGFVSSIATKLSDTFASEVGKAYGRNCYLITNFKKVDPGTEGAISIEGTFAGILGSILLSLISVELGIIELKEVPNVILSAFIATTIESYLGATIQGKKDFLTNEFINFINTFIGALIALFIHFV